MADLPRTPDNREEQYLASIAGVGADKPENPWSRKEAYLDAIDGKMDEIETQIQALATDLSYKGGVADYAHLPANPATGDVYTTEDDGILYVWDGTQWVALNDSASITPVQTTGTSTTDVMSQDATTKLIFPDIANAVQGQIRIDPSGTSSSTGNRGIAIGKKVELTYTNGVPIGIGFNTKAANNAISIGGGINGIGSDAVAVGSGSGNILANAVRIGVSSKAANVDSVAVGYNANAGGATNQVSIGSQSNAGSYAYSVALGDHASVNGIGAVAIGAYSLNGWNGTVEVGSSNSSYGYNSTNYRKVTGVYDGENLHDAATVAQGNTLSASAPTTSTVGVLGQLYTDTTGMHTYQCTAISGDTYTWTQRW